MFCFLVSPNVFYGVRLNTIDTALNPVSFDNIISLNSGGGPGLSQNGAFITPQCGIYFLQILADVPIQTVSLITVAGMQPPVNIARNKSVYNSTMYSSGIRKVQSDQMLSILSTKSSDAVDVLKLTFFGFRLDRLLSPLIAFDVASTQPWDINTTIPFDQVIVNEGFGWNRQLNTFTPPKSGIYFLSFSIGLPSQPVFTTVGLKLNSYAIMEADIDFTASATASNASYPDVVSWSLVYKLSLTHRATIMLYNGEVYSDPYSLQTSFRGFYYATQFAPSSYWFLLGNSMYLDVCQPQPIGFVTVVKSNIQLLELGAVVQVQISGIYMIMINSNTLVGADYGLRLQVNLNGNTILLAIRQDATKDGDVVGGIGRSGNIVTSLRSGDQLSVSQANQSCIYFSIMTTFGGMLLLPS